MNKFLVLALVAGLSSAATLDSLANEVTEAYTNYDDHRSDYGNNSGYRNSNTVDCNDRRNADTAGCKAVKTAAGVIVGVIVGVCVLCCIGIVACVMCGVCAASGGGNNNDDGYQNQGNGYGGGTDVVVINNDNRISS